MSERKKVALRNVRLAFPKLWKAEAYQDGDPQYSAVIILEPGHPQLDEVREAVKELANTAFGKGAGKAKLCVHKTEEKSEQYAGFEPGGLFFNANNKSRPTVVDKDRSPLTAEDGKPYAGAYVNASIEFHTISNKYGRFVSASLRGLQFSKDGERFAGGGTASIDEFDVLEEEDDVEEEAFDI